MTSRLELARQARLSKPVENLNPLEKLQRKPTSRAFAINAMCYQCMGEGSDSGWKWAIGNCSVKSCALFDLRPYQAMKGKPAQGAYKTEVA